MKCSVFIATSLDGFIARRDGGLDWLPGAEQPADGEDYGYYAFFQSIDTVIMGRHTYRTACGVSEWPYRGKKVVVLSRQYGDALTTLAQDILGTSLTPQALLAQLSQSGATHAYVDGGKTIQSFLAADLIDVMTITCVPILIGAGIPLFGALPGDRRWNHVATRSYSSGLVQSTYNKARLSHA